MDGDGERAPGLSAGLFSSSPVARLSSSPRSQPNATVGRAHENADGLDPWSCSRSAAAASGSPQSPASWRGTVAKANTQARRGWRLMPAPEPSTAVKVPRCSSPASSAGFPAPDPRVLIRDLAEELRDAKRRKLQASSFAAFEYALDKIVVPEIGHLRPSQAGPDRIARLIRDLDERGLQPASVRRYLSPLAPIFRLAIRRGLISTSPLALLSDEELPPGGGVREHYIWSPEEIGALIDAAEELGRGRLPSTTTRR